MVGDVASDLASEGGALQVGVAEVEADKDAGVLIGAETYEQLPDGAVVERRSGLRVKGKQDALDA